MVIVCSVKGCKNKYIAGTEISLFGFPKDKIYRDKWLDVCKNKNIKGKNARICSVHFKDSCYKPLSYPDIVCNTVSKHHRRLRDNAIPTEKLGSAKGEIYSISDVIGNPLDFFDIPEFDLDETKNEISVDVDVEVPSAFKEIQNLLTQFQPNESQDVLIQNLLQLQSKLNEQINLEEKNAELVKEIDEAENRSQKYYKAWMESQKRESLWRKEFKLYKTRAETAEKELKLAFLEKQEILRKLKASINC